MLKLWGSRQREIPQMLENIWPTKKATISVETACYWACVQQLHHPSANTAQHLLKYITMFCFLYLLSILLKSRKHLVQLMGKIKCLREKRKCLCTTSRLRNFWHLLPQEFEKAEHREVQNQSRQICEKVHKQTSKPTSTDAESSILWQKLWMLGECKGQDVLQKVAGLACSP